MRPCDVFEVPSKSTVCLHEGDGIDFIKALPDVPAYAVVTDPPYGIAHSSNRGASWQGTRIAGDEDTRLRDEVVAWATARNIPWAAFGTWKAPRPESTRAVLIWDKGPAFGMGDLSLPWKLSWEEIYIGGNAWHGRRDEGVLRGHMVLSWEKAGRKHPHQKPVSLMVNLIKKLPRGATVIDPFMGTGSTGVACVKAGVDFIGCEVDAKHFATAERRIKEANTTLF